MIDIVDRFSHDERATTVRTSSRCDGWWEFGSFIIPEAQWTEVKTQILDLFNDHQATTYKLADNCYRELKSRLHGKRRKNYWQAFQELPVSLRGTAPISNVIREELIRRDYDRLYKPRLQSFPYAGQKTEQLKFAFGLYIEIDNPVHTIRWRIQTFIPEEVNKLSVVQGILKVLTDVNYTRGTGGAIHCKHGSVGLGPLGKALV